MEGFQYIDIFATKGLEYILAITFLLVLIYFWRTLNRPKAARARTAESHVTDWVNFAPDYYYHRGHSWAVPVKENTLTIGMDDFSQKLAGVPSQINLPKVGTQLIQGEKGWQFSIDGHSFDMLSPVNGEVVEINENVIQKPAMINEDPYNSGWLLKVRSPRMRADLRNLLSGVLARTWLRGSVDEIQNRMSGNTGIVMADGGVPVSGFAREIEKEGWEDLVRQYLLDYE